MKPYSLIGVDGNAFSVMGYVSKAMKREHKPQKEIDAYLKDAQSSDYNHLIAVSVEMCENLNAEDNDRIVRVNWDTDGESIDECGLPENVSIPSYIPEYDVADYLSDTYGFCVNSWYEI